MPKRIIIIGGVAGGAACAARLRRLDEQAEIIVFERGPYVSFANCGLPYHLGGVISEEKKLLVSSPELFRDRFAITVKTHHDVRSIDRNKRLVQVVNVSTGVTSEEPYDALVLSPGAHPIHPTFPGSDLPGVFSVRTIPDIRRIREWIQTNKAHKALIVGAGFIGLEMAENMVHLGLNVTIVNRSAQVMSAVDPEIATPLLQHLLAKGVSVVLNDEPRSIRQEASSFVTTTKNGQNISADVIIMAIGVQPETTLARQAGLTIGRSGGITVDQHMRTSDPAIWAVGDAIETTDVVTSRSRVLALAGPANRQGRIAADSIAGRSTTFRGVQATSVCGVFDLTVASTGASEATLKRAGITDYAAVYLHPSHHVTYFPGARPIHLKVVYRPSDGRILGAQALGEQGVEKRIDVIAMALQLGGTVHDLSEAELCYAPQYGAAKDPVNMAGFIAENARNNDAPLADWSAVTTGAYTVVDVREPAEVERGTFAGAIPIPLHQLRSRWQELPTDKPIAVLCAAGQRAYYGVRQLRQQGFDARLLSGGWTTWQHLLAARSS